MATTGQKKPAGTKATGPAGGKKKSSPKSTGTAATKKKAPAKTSTRTSTKRPVSPSTPGAGSRRTAPPPPVSSPRETTPPPPVAPPARGGSTPPPPPPERRHFFRDRINGAPRRVRRGVAALGCLLLALFVFLGYFGVDALVINAFRSFLRGMIGYGYYLVGPMLLICTGILTFHHGQPVRFRVFCTMHMPAIISSVIHLLASNVEYPLHWKNFSDLFSLLWENGGKMDGGGVLSGLTAELLSLAFSPLGAGAIFVVVGVALVMGATDFTIVDLLDWLEAFLAYEEQRYPRRRGFKRQSSYEDPDFERRIRETAPPPPPAQTPGPPGMRPGVSRRISDYDMPLGDVPETDGEAADPQEGLGADGIFQATREKFFNRSPSVPNPADVLEGRSTAAPRHSGHGLSKPEPLSHGTGAEAPKPPLGQYQRPGSRRYGDEMTPEKLAEVQAAFHERVPPHRVKSEPVPGLVPTPEELRRLEQTERLVAKAEIKAAKAEVSEAIEEKQNEAAPAYQFPPLDLLHEGIPPHQKDVEQELELNQGRLADTIQSFGVDATIRGVVRGPAVARYELELAQGVRMNKLTKLADDIALALGAESVRIAAIPGKISMVGVEVPNQVVDPVALRDVIASETFQNSKSKISFAVGKDLSNRCVVCNIAKLPHLLIAGTTGSGKSVCINSILVSLLYKASPEDVKFIMVDPKLVELGVYNGIPHLYIPVVTDPKKAAGALQWAVSEMMKRYRTFADNGVRDLKAYNTLASQREDLPHLPSVVVVIDELADLMLVAAREVEESICRVAQMGRAAGVHLIIATQRPSTDVITGLMKANIPSRIAFEVHSAIDSRIILDNTGAEKLLGKGDMLYFPVGSGKPRRVQGCFVSDEEVFDVVEHIKKSGATAQYSEEIMHEIEKNVAEKEKGNKGGDTEAMDSEQDEMLDDAIDVVVEMGMASVSMLQRRLKLGYSRAARLVDQMEMQGIVGPFEGSKPRQVLVSKDQLAELRYHRSLSASAPKTPPPAPAPVRIPDPEPEDEEEEDEDEVLPVRKPAPVIDFQPEPELPPEPEEESYSMPPFDLDEPGDADDLDD